MNLLLKSPFLIKLLHWEYWNSKVIYAPLYPYYLWLSIKARSFYFLTAANPLIRNGGYIMESKKDVYNLMPAELYPATLLFTPGTSIEAVMAHIKDASISFPLIAKPDIGERGLAVKKIDNEAMLFDYVTHMEAAYLIQQFVPYENEVGIFYCKLPGEKKGYITGIVNKEPVTVTGDGIATLAMLVKSNPRYLLQWNQIRSAYPDQMDCVLNKGHTMILIPYGNHVRGSKFTDVTFRANTNLNETFDRICSSISQFYYGRLDVRFNSWEDLELGKKFSIIELNGSGSEPTHIYDPAHSLFYAWGEIIRHWKLLYAISTANHKKGVPFTTFSQANRDRKSFNIIESQLSKRAW